MSKRVLSLIIFVTSLTVALFATPAQATIVYTGASSGANNALPTDTTAGPLTINIPVGTVAGQALIATIAARPSGMTVTVPANWFAMTVTQQLNGGPSTLPGGMTLLTYYHIVGLAEPASYTWTFANTAGSGASYGGSAVGGLLAFSGIDTSGGNPINVWSALNVNAAPHTTTSITPTVTNTMIVSSISYLSGSSFANPTSSAGCIVGITERLDQRAPAAVADIGTTLQMSTATCATATASGTVTAVIQPVGGVGADDSGVGHLMALKPALIDPGITMTRSAPLSPGGTAFYTLSVTNSGINSEPGPISVIDTLPAGLTYNAAGSGGAGWVCGAVGQVVTCTRAGALAGGAAAAALVLNVNVGAGASGVITNTATVSGTGGDGNMANNTATDSYNIAVDLALAMARVGTLDPGLNASYTLNVTNNGTRLEPGSITITDTLPAGLTYVSGTGAGWICGAVGQVVTCTRAGSLAGGAAAATLTLTVAVGQTAFAITNTATVAGTGGDSNPANNSATDTYNMAADLSLTKTRGAALVPGTNATYTLNVTNSGPNVAPQPITITDTLPANLTYVSGVGAGWVCGAVGQVVTCTRSGTLANGASSALALTVAVGLGANGTTIANSATVTGPAVDSTPANNTATDSFTIPLSTYAYYKMDEATWTGAANEVLDSSGNGLHATKIGGATVTTVLAPASGLKGDTCRGATIPLGTGAATQMGVNVPVNPNTMGTAGTISFWYKNNVAWTAAGATNDRTLLDATGAATGEFWLVLQQAGSLRFMLDNAGGTAQTITGAAKAFAANTWHHIAITWNFTTNTMSTYVDGVLDATRNNVGVTSAINYSTFVIGDSKLAVTTAPNRGNSANGVIDEVRVYTTALSAAQITADMIATHTCATVDHYELSLPTNSITCMPSAATVVACADNSSPCTNKYAVVSGQTALLAASGGTLGATTVTFDITGTANTTLSYSAAADGTAVTVTLSGEQTAASNPRKCCPNGVGCVVANSCSTTFNTTGFIFSSSAGGANATIPTQVAGTSSATFYLRAIKSNTKLTTATQACEAALSGLQSVNFAYECNNPATCFAANLMSVNGGSATTIARNNNGSVATYTPVNLTFDANGNAPFTFNYLDVGQVTLWTSKAAGGSLLSTLTGSSNPFVVKPFGFVLSGIQQTAAPNLANPGAANATGAKFVMAGEAFSATATAVTSTGSTAFNYGKESSAEGVKLASALVAGFGLTNNPAVANPTAFGAFTNGVATGTTFNWPEVGVITLTPSVGDGDYLGVGDVTGTIANVGRFYAAKFALSAGSIANRTDIAACAPPCGSFTYMGEQMNAVFTLTAKAVDGITTLQNYNWSATPANQFAKLNPLAAVIVGTGGPLGLGAVDSPAVRTPFPPCAAIPAHPCLTPAQATAGTFATGVANVSVPFSIFRGNTPVGPFAALGIGIAPLDSDGAILSAYDLDTVNVVAGANNHAKVGANTEARFGRLWMANAYGSEKRSLTIPYETQYWTGQAFVRNLLDANTAMTAANFGIGNYQGAVAPANLPATAITLGLFSTGLGSVTLAAPTPNAVGSVDVVARLGGAAAAMCPPLWAPAYPAGAPIVAAYLQGKWCGAAYDRDPVVRATFGIFGDSTKKGPIYLRENF